jgi:hypothetical protein
MILHWKLLRTHILSWGKRGERLGLAVEEGERLGLRLVLLPQEHREGT